MLTGQRRVEIVALKWSEIFTKRVQIELPAARTKNGLPLGFAQPHVTEAILNHINGSAKQGVASTYNWALYLAERREALEKWARFVMELVAK